MANAPNRAGSTPSGAAPESGRGGRVVSLGRYDLLFRIASGGMAEVHAGRARGEAGFEKLVAIKRMHPHLAEDPHFVDMFLDEARVASQVASPHVVQTLDLGRADDGSLFLVMDLVIGLSLSMLVRAGEKRGLVPLPIALEILAQSAQGLDDAHDAATATGVALGIVHRDVSPQNLLVGLDGRTRVTDFGIARALLRRTSTSTGELKGKIAYFSPEQACATEVDRRSDVFSLGIVAWETVTGQRLFRDGEALLTLRRLIEETVPNPRTIRPEIPVPVAQVILRAVCREPAGRWQSAGEMAIALREAAREIGRAPTAKEIGRWVADVGGDKLRSMRERIDLAMSAPPQEIDEEAATTLRPATSEPASGVVPRSGVSVSSVSIDVITEPPQVAPPAPVASVPSAPVSSAAPSLPLSIDDEPALSRPGRTRAWLVAAAVAAAIGGVFWLGRASTTDPIVDARTSPSAVVSAAPSAVAPLAPSASAPSPRSSETTASPPIATGSWNVAGNVARPRGRLAPTADRLQRPAPADAPPTTPPPAPPAAAPDPTPAATAPKTGPLLGDDAFNRDVSRKH